jgi:spermidine synthase
MQQELNRIFSRYRKQWIYVILLFSGISALIYQVIWIRKFGLVFGQHVFSMSTVLTAFMAGLALGSLLFGKIADRRKNPLSLFLWLEIGIGLFAIFFPFLFDGLTLLYTQIAKSLYINTYYVQLIRFFLSFLFLLIPTTLMGGTLPVIIKYAVNDLKNFGSKVSALYSINNLGAVIGCFAAGYFLINNFGLLTSLYVAAFLNVLNGLMVFLLYSNEKNPAFIPKSSDVTAPGKKSDPAPQIILPPRILKVVLWVFAIEGFTTLAYEVLWTRVLVGFSFDKTTYFFTVILIGFIFGLSLGSFLIKKYIDRIKDLVGMLIFIQVFIGITSVLSLILFSKIAPALIQQRDIFGSWLENSGKEYFIFFLLLTIPTTLMGMTYPVVSKIYTDNMKSLGKKMGLLGFMDTVGSILGSFIAGFIFIPFLGVVHSFVLTVFLNILLGLLVLVFHPQYHIKRKLSYAVLILIAGVTISFRVPVKNYFSWWDSLKFKESWFGDHYDEILFYDEGEAATVMVLRYSSEETRSLMINGHNTAYTSRRDLSANRQLGYIPYVLHPNPKNAFVVGFGLGVTAHTLSRPDMDHVDVAEIVPGVIQAAPVFQKWNYNIQNNPKAHIFDEDGRSLLLMTDKKYDIITSNAIHPRLSNNIYTRDFYKICRNKLAEGGIVYQWIPQNWMTETEYKSLLKAFTDVFPHCSLWYVNEYSTLIIGSDKPLDVPWKQIEEKYQDPVLLEEMSEVGIGNPEWFVSQYWMSDEQLRTWVEGFPANTDNFPLVEFSKVISIEPNLTVMEELLGAEPDYSSFLEEYNPEEKNEKIKSLNKHYEYNKNAIFAVIQAIHYHRQKK